MKKESAFQSDLIKRIQNDLGPECLVYDNDGGYLQGFPDLSIYYKDKWAFLECKQSADAKVRPNQEFYIRWANNVGSFGRFIFPENKEEVLNELYNSLGATR